MRFSAHEESVLVAEPFCISAAVPRSAPCVHAEPARCESPEEHYGLLRGALGSTAREHPVVGFTACGGEGAGPATLAFGRELVADGKQVAVANLSDIQRISPEEVEAFDPDLLLAGTDRLFHWRPGAGAAASSDRGRNPAASSDARIWLVELLRSSFDFTLIESPPLDNGMRPLLLAALCDAVVLVVEAGRSRTSQIERARRTLETVNANVIGCVLTGRSYPVPGWIYSRL